MIAATSSFKAGSVSADALVAALGRGVDAGTKILADEAQSTVAVETGALRDSIAAQPSEADGNVVTGTVTAGTDHAFFVEYGTGRRGAASAGAGAGPYDENWAGMPAQPYMRPALDTRKDDVLAAIASEVSDAL